MRGKERVDFFENVHGRAEGVALACPVGCVQYAPFLIQKYSLEGGGADVDSRKVVHLSIVSQKAARRVLTCPVSVWE